MSPSVSTEIISPQRAGESTAVSSRWRTGQIILCVLLALFAAWYATLGWHSPLGDSGKADNFSVMDLAGFVVAGVLVWLTTPTAWTIAATTFQEAIRRKWLTLLLGFALVMLAVSTFFTWMQPGSEQKFLRDFGVGFTVIMMLIVSVFLGIALIPPEIERRTIFTILSKPVNRVEFLLGKYWGLCLVLLVNLALMTLMFLIAYSAFVIRQEHGFKAALEATGSGVSPRGLVFDLVNLTKDLALQFCLGAVMGALALLLSQVMTNIISIIFSFIVYFLGQSASYWEHLADKNAALGPALAPPVRDVVNFVYFFLPRLDRFDVRERLINDLPVGFNYMIKADSNSLVYIAVLLALAYFVFGDREF
jgi:hypothetical protein